ncbi:hypothetical protein FIBSPDRAFT_900497 [Athelia psychrophila]|uniref:Uncharacterized protein n=1 Tax=Athelia psychrophila TaxID=1759441 RepID=A0A165YEP4_9AGAM|nr:hypothetical protein FIBSPDRAFT_900497 [Fibularhizoctonia sp. CBS 109695]
MNIGGDLTAAGRDSGVVTDTELVGQVDVGGSYGVEAVLQRDDVENRRDSRGHNVVMAPVPRKGSGSYTLCLRAVVNSIGPREFHGRGFELYESNGLSVAISLLRHICTTDSGLNSSGTTLTVSRLWFSFLALIEDGKVREVRYTDVRSIYSGRYLDEAKFVGLRKQIWLLYSCLTLTTSLHKLIFSPLVPLLFNPPRLIVLLRTFGTETHYRLPLCSTSGVVVTSELWELIPKSGRNSEFGVIPELNSRLIPEFMELGSVKVNGEVGWKVGGATNARGGSCAKGAVGGGGRLHS